jgi:hypothetical protein
MPTKFALMINLKVTEALGPTVPLTPQAGADDPRRREMIE